MLFCSSFTQSERFLQTDQLIVRLQVVVMTNFIRMLMRNVFVNVFKSDAVIWWAAIFRSFWTPLLLGRRVHRIPRVCNRTFDPNCNSRIAATVLDGSSPISIGHHHDRTLRNARNTRNIMIATNDHVACRISNQISQQTLDVDFITSGSCADVSGQLTNYVLDVRTIQPE